MNLEGACPLCRLRQALRRTPCAAILGEADARRRRLSGAAALLLRETAATCGFFLRCVLRAAKSCVTRC